MSQIQTAIKVKINESALIRNLGAVFTNKTKVLSELLQNGRRAGATSIGITFNDETKTLVVIDNGCGINDMQNLLTVAESGWDSETISIESAFGMGFLATLFTAKAVKVESKGRQVAFATSTAINMDSIAVESSDFIGGTRVTLEGFDVLTKDIENALIAGVSRPTPYSAGFPIPIFFNEVELARPDAVNDHFIDCEIGKVLLFSSTYERSDLRSNSKAGCIFLQGLPVIAGIRPVNTIVHLNDEFKARMPDRDVLLNVEDASVRILRVVKAEYRKHYEALKALDPMKLFESNNYQIINHFGLLDLMNDIDVVPENFLQKFDDYPVVDSYEMNPSKRTGFISKAQLESGEVMVLRAKPEAGDWGRHTMALAMLAWKLEMPMLQQHLHPDHWVNKLGYPTQEELLSEDLFDTNVSIAFTAVKVGSDIILVDSYTVTYHGKSFTFKEEAVSIGGSGYEESDVIMPSGEHSSCVLHQFNNWENNDVFDERWRDEEEDAFLCRLALLRGEESAVTLQKIFKWGDINNSNLIGKSFTVEFVEDNSGDFVHRTVVVKEIIKT